MINQRCLEALRAFVECGSVSNAAARLLRTPPQVSRLLSALEEEVGLEIFSRRGRKLHLTKAGEEFYKEVEHLMSASDQLDRRADQIRRGQKDHIRILTAPFISHALINHSLARVMARHPRMTAQVESRVRLDIDVWVTEETFDLGIAPLPIKAGPFEIEPFLDLPMVVAMHVSHPLARLRTVSFDDFVEHEIIATHAQSLLGQHLETLCNRTGKRLKIRIQARNGVIACQLAGLNLACCLADPFVALSSGVENLVLRPFEPTGVLRYAFLYPTWANRTAAVDEMSKEIRDTALELKKRIFHGEPATDPENG
ncbi:LysR family transcriptional regulator [Breoghania sp. L-A4]|uniref:LysR family transcriptional regulator n=1 Tax=Breoghania sp. L-A4 TaxID=2304600 RepID=UPI000E359167|nr:LysR family transcriptional regulator [Breoghania sp. L-A4]AXS40083.1 LysR family transcriptional regulator [Breoghania sp. L-A4]